MKQTILDFDDAGNVSSSMDMYLCDICGAWDDDLVDDICESCYLGEEEY